MAKLCDAFLAAASTRWTPRRPGSCNSELDNCVAAFKPLLHLYGDLPASELNPVRLRAVQLFMVEAGLCCGVVNARIARIRRCVKWAVARMLLAPAVLEGLRAVEPVRPPQAPYHPPVQPVSLEVVEATLPWLVDQQRGTDVVRRMVTVQMLTGMRPGELCAMKGQDIQGGSAPSAAPTMLLSTSVATGANGRWTQSPWLYRPPSHKNAWRQRERVIPLGPRCQMVLTPLLRPGHVFLTKRGGPFTTNSYSQCIARACRRAGLPHWSPNMLRHAGLTVAAQRTGGTTVPQHLAGHSDPRTTARYVQTWDVAASYAQRYG